MIVAMQENLSQNVQLITEKEPYKQFKQLACRMEFLDHPFRNDCLAWIGGSLFGGTKFTMPTASTDALHISDWTAPEKEQ
jgi:hypothetical protein